MKLLRRSDTQVLLLALAAGLPGTVASLALAWTVPAVPSLARWSVTLLVPVLWIGFAEAVRRRFARPLQTLANLIASLRVGDFSARARVFNPVDPLGLASLELNLLTDQLRHVRLGEMEAAALMAVAKLRSIRFAALLMVSDASAGAGARLEGVALERATEQLGRAGLAALLASG